MTNHKNTKLKLKNVPYIPYSLENLEKAWLLLNEEERKEILEKYKDRINAQSYPDNFFKKVFSEIKKKAFEKSSKKK